MKTINQMMLVKNTLVAAPSHQLGALAGGRVLTATGGLREL